MGKRRFPQNTRLVDREYRRDLWGRGVPDEWLKASPYADTVVGEVGKIAISESRNFWTGSYALMQLFQPYIFGIKIITTKNNRETVVWHFQYRLGFLGVPWLIYVENSARLQL